MSQHLGQRYNLDSRFFADYEKIVADIPQFCVPETVTVVGTGAFGSWVAYFAAIAGVKQLVLINPGSDDGSSDEDIHEREIAVGPYRMSDLRRSKVLALKEIINEMRPDAKVETHIQLFDHRSEKCVRLLKGVIFAGVSNTETNHGTFQAALRLGLRCFSGRYNGVRFGVVSHLPKSETIGGNEIPVWVGSAALSALFALHAACVESFNYYGDLEEVSLRSADFDAVMERDEHSI